jgi:hypothetical protein
VTENEARAVATEAAQDIIAAVEGLPEYLGDALSWRLLTHKSAVFAAIGEALRDAEVSDRAAALGQSLLIETFLGEVETKGSELSDELEPWRTIRASLEPIARAWRASHPGLRTKHEFDLQRAARGW